MDYSMMQILFVKNDRMIFIKIEHAMWYVSWDHLVSFYKFQRQWMSIICRTCENVHYAIQ